MEHSVIKRIFPLIMIMALVLMPAVVQASPQPAQADPISLTAQVGFDSFYRRGEWIPVQVTVANSGSDVEGYLVVEQTGTSPSEEIRFQTPVILPGQSRKTISFYVGIDKYQTSLTVQLMDGSRVLAAERVRIKQVNDGDLLYGLISGELVDMAFLQESVAYLTLDDLPELGSAWKALDALILNNVDTGKLTPDQLQAMKDWLNTGGRLIVTGGPNWRKTAANLSDLLPVTISGSASSYDLDSLSNLSNSPFSEGPFVAAQAKVSDGRVLLANDDIPLLVLRPYGMGQVDWLALDLALAPLRDWGGNDELWNIILGETGSYAPWITSTINYWAARDGLKSIPSLALPSAMQMVLFLLAYTTIVGPINYFILNRRKRRELGWFTIPAIVLLFSGLAYVTGFQLKGGDVIINRRALVYGAAGADSGQARTMLGIFSPSRATYDIVLPKEVLARPMVSDDNYGGLGSDSSGVVEQGNDLILKEVQVDVGGLRAFHAQSHIALPAIRAELTIDASNYPQLKGSVTNLSDMILEDASVMLGESIFELGDLGPGETSAVSLRLSNGRASRAPNPSSSSSGSAGYYPAPSFPHYLAVDKLIGGSNYWTDKTLNRRYQILQAFVDQNSSATPPQTAILAAWSEQALWPIKVEGRESKVMDTVGFLLELPVELATGAEKMTVPPALTTWQALDGNRYDESGPYNLYLSNQWARFQFQPWDAFQLSQVDKVELTISMPSSHKSPRVSLWNWRSGAWEEDPTLGRGTNTIQNLDDYIGPNNAVRIRVESNSPAGINIDRLDVSYIGSAP